MVRIRKQWQDQQRQHRHGNKKNTRTTCDRNDDDGIPIADDSSHGIDCERQVPFW
jgi:hypothetical protein